MEGKNGQSIPLLIFTIILFSVLFPTPGALSNTQIKVSFNPRFNEPPDAPLNIYPSDGAINVEIPVTLQVYVYDETQLTGSIDVYFYNASNNSLIGVDNDVPARYGNTASVVWNGLQKGRSYSWYAVANDSRYENASDIWGFSTKPNQPPIIHNNEYPANTSTNIEIQTGCHITISDPDSDTMDIYWYENSTGTWVLRQTNTSVVNGTYYWHFVQATNYSARYYWKIAVNDSMANTTAILYFTTVPNQPPVISNPSPENRSGDVSILTSYWNVTVKDPENDTVSWVIETSPYIGNMSGNTTGASCLLAGLSYSTTYTIYVNATDAGSYMWTNKTFWFETAAPGAPTISNEYPPNRSTHIELRPTCQIDVQDLEGDSLTVYWYERSTGSWVLRQTDTNVSSNSTLTWIFSQADAYSTTYYWKVSVNDSFVNTTAIYHFTTKPRPYSPGPGDSYSPPPNKSPIANITGQAVGYVDETVIFCAYYSYDTDGYITGYRWDFDNDGLFDTDWLEDLFTSYTYHKAGNYTVKLQVRDNDGAKSTDSYVISIIVLKEDQYPPIAEANGPYEAFINENISFNATDSYDPDGAIVLYYWDFGDHNISSSKNPIHSYAEPGEYIAILTVTDNDNLTNSAVVSVHIKDNETEEPVKESLYYLPFIVPLLMIIIAFIIVMGLLLKNEKFLSLKKILSVLRYFEQLLIRVYRKYLGVRVRRGKLYFITEGILKKSGKNNKKK